MSPVGKNRDCALRDLYFVPCFVRKSVGNVRVSDSDDRPSASGSLLGAWRTCPQQVTRSREALFMTQFVKIDHGVRSAITTSCWLTGPLNIRRGAGGVRDEDNEEPVEMYGDSADCDLYRNVGMLDSDD
jgi:hypothetical protein